MGWVSPLIFKFGVFVLRHSIYDEKIADFLTSHCTVGQQYEVARHHFCIWLALQVSLALVVSSFQISFWWPVPSPFTVCLCSTVYLWLTSRPRHSRYWMLLTILVWHLCNWLHLWNSTVQWQLHNLECSSPNLIQIWATFRFPDISHLGQFIARFGKVDQGSYCLFTYVRMIVLWALVCFTMPCLSVWFGLIAM